MRKASIVRNTKETQIELELDLDGFLNDTCYITNDAGENVSISIVSDEGEVDHENILDVV